jgi:thioredoxin 1
MAKEFTDGNFQNEVLSADKLTVVDFWAEWCGPCRAIGPVIESLAKEYDGKINVGKVNVDVKPSREYELWHHFNSCNTVF